MQNNKESKVVDFNPMTPQAEPQLLKVKTPVERPEKELTPAEKAEKHSKIVDPEIMANIRKNEAEKAVANAVQNLVHGAMESYVYKWNDIPANKNNQIELRLKPTSAPASNGMFQFCLALELKKDGLWRVLTRIGLYSHGGDARTMALLTTDLYKGMFVELAHSGILTASAISDQRIHTDYAKTQQAPEIVN